MNIFLDSGAYSAKTKGVTISLDKYSEFINSNSDKINLVANLDVIGDAEASYKNLKDLEKNGVKALPVFHQGEDLKWLKGYIDEGYEYLAIGGIVGINRSALIPFLDEVWGNYILDSSGDKRIKVHGFGMTAHKLLFKYQWDSVDSSTWVMTGRLGAVLLPGYENGTPDFSKRSTSVFVTQNADPKRKHYTRLKDAEGICFCDWIERNSMVVGDPNKKGLDNDFRCRDLINASYYNGLNSIVATTVFLASYFDKNQEIPLNKIGYKDRLLSYYYIQGKEHKFESFLRGDVIS